MVSAAPFTVEDVQVDGGSEFMAEFKTSCRERGVTVAVQQRKPPKRYVRVERMQATLRNEFCDGQDTAVSVNRPSPLPD